MEEKINKRIYDFPDGKSVWIISELLFRMYRFSGGSIRKFICRVVIRLEGGDVGEYFSKTIRRIFSVYHQVTVGMYTGIGCFVVGNFLSGTTIGRYTSIFPTVRAFNVNHPMNTKSTNAIFYNPYFRFCQKDPLERTNLSIGNDVFLGHNVIILSSVSSIGDGAVIGAGTIVHKDIPPYAVVVGNPGRVVRYRFPEEKIRELLESRWWEKSAKELLPEAESFFQPLGGDDRIR